MNIQIDPTTLTINGKLYKYFSPDPIDENKQTVIALHGAGGTIKDSEYLFGSLRDTGTQVVSIGIPGHDALPEYDIKSIEELSDYVADFIKYFDFQTFSTAGFSLGGLISLKFTELYNSPNLKASVIWASPISGLNKKLTFTLNLFNLLETKLKPDQRLPVSPKLLSSIKHELVQKWASNITDTSISFMPKVLKIIANPNYSFTPNVPTMFIFGDKDMLLKSDCVDVVNSKTKACATQLVKTVTIKDGGHFGKEEQHQKAAEEIANFLNKLNVLT